VRRLYQARSLLCAFNLFAILFIAGCAHRTGTTSTNDAENAFWTGRISLQIDSDPPQAFFAGFELKGKAERGELTLTSPIGSVLGVMRWSPDEAVLESGNDTRHFASVGALLEKTTGAAVPVAALFDWLNGQNTVQSGWSADLSRQASGRVDATRIDPPPQTRLRIVLDQ
jgi:outer membrane lipoprotein LolB